MLPQARLRFVFTDDHGAKTNRRRRAVPRRRWSVARSGVPWAADNDAFNRERGRSPRRLPLPSRAAAQVRCATSAPRAQEQQCRRGCWISIIATVSLMISARARRAARVEAGMLRWWRTRRPEYPLPRQSCAIDLGSADMRRSKSGRERRARRGHSMVGAAVAVGGFDD